MYGVNTICGVRLGGICPNFLVRIFCYGLPFIDYHEEKLDDQYWVDYWRKDLEREWNEAHKIPKN